MNDELIPPTTIPDLAPTLVPSSEMVAEFPSCVEVPGYEILGEIGRGGMGVVYKARQIKADRLVALKMILSGQHAGDDEMKRFRTEAEAVARLQHANIVQVHDVGEHEGRPFFSLEFCEGGSLEKKLSGTPLPPREAAELVEQLARAMQHAHEHRVIHRDLKPANVLLQEKEISRKDAKSQRGDTKENQVQYTSGSAPSSLPLCVFAPLREISSCTPKITDFGLAKKLDDVGQTASGAIMGTPSYMAPEQAAGKAKQLGPACDIYALGAILYDCLAGRPPFKAATALDTILQVINDDPVPLTQLNRTVPRDLETICHKCLLKEPGKRYDAACGLADDLRRFLNGEPIAARPVGAIERAVKWVKRNPTTALLSSTTALMLLLGIVVSTYFAIEANDERDRAENEKTFAQSETERAEGEKNKAEEREKFAQGETKRAEEQLRRAEWLVYAGKLSLAWHALDDNATFLAINHLDECQWNLRGWEHRHLWTRCVGCKQTLKGHTRTVLGVAFSPDGTRILTGSQDTTAIVWDARRGVELLTLKGHADQVTSVAFSPDGKRILTGSRDGTAKVWDAEKGVELLTLKGHAGFVTSTAFSPDGRRILTGSADTTAKVWDAEKGVELLTLRGHAFPVWSATFSPDGTRILTASGDKTAKVWDARKGDELLTLKGHTDFVVGAAFSPDGNRIVTACDDGTARVWDAAKGTELRTLGHAKNVFSAAFSPDGRHIATGSGDTTLKLWDAETGVEVIRIKGHVSEVTRVAFSPDGRRIVTTGDSGTAKVWDADTSADRILLRGHTGSNTCSTFSADGTRLLIGSEDGTTKVWDTETGGVLHNLKGHEWEVTCAAFSADGRRIVTGSKDKSAKVWDAATGIELHTFKDPEDFVIGAAISPDGRRVVTAVKDKTTVWDADNGRELFTLKGHTDLVPVTAFSPNGRRIVTGSVDGTAKVWDAENGTDLLTLKGHSKEVSCAAFNAAGTRVITGSNDKTAKVWDAETGRLLFTLQGHTGYVISATFSPDGQRILTGSRDGTAKLWDAEHGQEVLVLKPHRWVVICSAFSPDGRRILTGGGDEIRVWRADKRQDILMLKGHANLVDSTAFSPDGKRVFAWDTVGNVLAWTVADGKAADPRDAPPMPPPGPARSPDGRLTAGPEGSDVAVFDPRRPEGDPWPFPEAAQRKMYHTEQVALAEKESRHFAVAFHLGRLLLDDRDNVDLKRRRDEALKKHAAK